jgi:hypothetical protein
MCHRLKCSPAFIYCTGIDRSHLTFIQSASGIDPSAAIRHIAGQVVMAYLQSGFPSQDIRGKYRIKHLFNFQSSLEGVEYVPLLISRFLGRFRRGVRKIFL